MAEKLLVCDALDERDFLRKKIITAIKTTKFVGSKRIKDAKVNGITVKEEFESEAKSNYQSITDLIDRYNRLDTAITQANAVTEIETRSGKKMTRASAISLRKALFYSDSDSDFTGSLIREMQLQLNNAVSSVANMNRKADTELESYKSSLTSKDSKSLTEDQIDMCEKLTADLHGELIDPLGIEKKIAELSESYNALKKELDSAIKVSNATTYVEF
jgi:hypothetical protein